MTLPVKDNLTTDIGRVSVEVAINNSHAPEFIISASSNAALMQLADDRCKGKTARQKTLPRRENEAG